MQVGKGAQQLQKLVGRVGRHCHLRVQVGRVGHFGHWGLGQLGTQVGWVEWLVLGEVGPQRLGKVGQGVVGGPCHKVGLAWAFGSFHDHHGLKKNCHLCSCCKK